jgi:hypothetical protein
MLSSLIGMVCLTAALILIIGVVANVLFKNP